MNNLRRVGMDVNEEFAAWYEEERARRMRSIKERQEKRDMYPQNSEVQRRYEEEVERQMRSIKERQERMAQEQLPNGTMMNALQFSETGRVAKGHSETEVRETTIQDELRNLGVELSKLRDDLEEHSARLMPLQRPNPEEGLKSELCFKSNEGQSEVMDTIRTLNNQVVSIRSLLSSVSQRLQI